MMHMSIFGWRKYVQDELLEEEREVYENHLYTCDQCLELYIQAVAESEAELPTLANETAIADAVIAKVEKVKHLEQRVKPLELHRNEMPTAGQPPEMEARPDVVQLQTKVQQKDGKVVSIKRKQQRKKQKQPVYQTAAFHYVLAAAITLLLMVSGAFTSIVNFTETVKEQGLENEGSSFTEELLNKTFTLMDEVDEKLKEEPSTQGKWKRKKTEEVGK